MKLATLDKIIELGIDHSRGTLVNKATDKRVTLRHFRFVYARYSKKLFQKQGQKWAMTCSSSDSVTGHPRDGEPLPCGSASMCLDCKPELTLGLVGEDGKLYVLETRASVARSFSEALEPLSNWPLPIFDQRFSLSVALTTKSSNLSYAQVRIQPAGPGEANYEELVRHRQTLRRVIDGRVDRASSSRQKKQDWGIKMGGNANLLSLAPVSWPE